VTNGDGPSVTFVPSDLLEPGEPEADCAPLPGTLLQDRYLFEQFLAAGRSARVFKGVDTTTTHAVAIKVVAPSAHTRVKEEIEALRRIQSLRVVRLLDLAEWEGRQCIVMEFLPGRTLRRVLLRGRTVLTAAKIGLDLVEAIAVCHELGLAHGDPSPTNFICHKGAPSKLCDLNLSVMPEQLSRGGGTPGYQAPELLADKHAQRGLRTDVYALGVLLLELLCGRRPYSFKKKPDEALEATRDACLPPPLQGVLGRCLAAAPEDRYLNAMALRNGLAGVVQTLELEDAQARAFESGSFARRAGEEFAGVTLNRLTNQTETHDHWLANEPGSRSPAHVWLLRPQYRNDRRVLRRLRAVVAGLARTDHPMLPRAVREGWAWPLQHYVLLTPGDGMLLAQADPLERWGGLAEHVADAQRVLHNAGIACGTLAGALTMPQLQAALANPEFRTPPLPVDVDRMDQLRPSLVHEDISGLAQALLDTKGRPDYPLLEEVLHLACDVGYDTAAEFRQAILAARSARREAEAHQHAARNQREAEHLRLRRAFEQASQQRRKELAGRIIALTGGAEDPLDCAIDALTAPSWSAFLVDCATHGHLQEPLEAAVTAVLKRWGVVQGPWMADGAHRALVSLLTANSAPEDAYKLAMVRGRHRHADEVERWIAVRHEAWHDEQRARAGCNGLAVGAGVVCAYCEMGVPYESEWHGWCRLVRRSDDHDWIAERAWLDRFRQRTLEFARDLRDPDPTLLEILSLGGALEAAVRVAVALKDMSAILKLAPRLPNGLVSRSLNEIARPTPEKGAGGQR
jgi:hypothetical protein